jgi:urocanate hydratase
MNGVARRAWARNPHAMETVDAFNKSNAEGYHITVPFLVDEDLINDIVN